MELLQQILSTIQTPWAIALASILGALFPVTEKAPPGQPDKTQPLLWSIIKRFMKGQPKIVGAEPILVAGRLEFTACQDALKYLAEQAHAAGNVALRDATLDLLRPFATLQFPDPDETTAPAHPTSTVARGY